MPPKPAKYTRGEKCLCAHIVITLAVVAILTIVYIVHLFLVTHKEYYDAFKITRRAYDPSISGLSISDYQSIGVAYLNTTPVTTVCVTLLLHARWSLAPAQCTSMRDDPDMALYLYSWNIKYKINGKHINSDIKRTLTHSHFSREDYHNNIGLFEHEEPINKKMYYVGDTSDSVVNAVRPIYSYKCAIYADPIVQLRDYEFCVAFEQDGPIADHGAMLVMNSTIIGFFSWGDIKGKGVPLIILNIIHFREWFESIVSL
ncbi:hypothetical protein B5X24_HaOG206564 [Helicoverpa armigera]|uniref:Peptidase S1 domain-containing protein n=1 Tax=Helicoverpa armigera TaxID=29058 RepID=A0A2W1BJI9_HELAM|nr:hypothetical protein B5X24_HaOG206564 [Helicoverpa armigera]